MAANLRIKGSTPYYGANGIQDYVEGYTHDGEFVLVAEDGANDLKNYPVNYVNGRVWVNNHAHVLQAKESIADNRFIGYAISRANIESVLVGGGRAKLNAEVLIDISLKIPTKKEQVQISSFISSLDNLITLHQRKLFEAKNNPKNGSKNFFRKIYQKLYKFDFNFKTYDWEQRKLGEIAEFNPKSDLPDEFEYVDLESVVGTEMVFHRTEKKASAPSRAQRVAKTGDVFFQTVRPYQRNNYLFSMPYENYVFSTGYAQMRPKINAAFLMCFLQTESFVQNVLDNCTGTSYPAINSSDLSNLKISLPILKSEQSKIGKLISNLDHLITLHQREVFYTLKYIFYRCCDTLLSGGL
ncbi:type I restriction enzyme, S subunit [Streptococcus equinus]|nr:type I restriction enzyme, S subunit [Streptococcus equinus]